MRKKIGLSRAVLRLMDIFFALILLPFALTAFMLILLPQLFFFKSIFYTAQRIGRYERPFCHIKLKTMTSPRPSSANGGGRAYLEAARIPAWGRALRKTHLDEIPELLFIFAGRESFVGPRPLLAEHTALVSSPERQAVKPGWTGLSQVYLKTRGILPSRVQRRLDQKLARELEPWLYIGILCATFRARKKRPAAPGPTVVSYRQSLQVKFRDNNTGG